LLDFEHEKVELVKVLEFVGFVRLLYLVKDHGFSAKQSDKVFGAFQRTFVGVIVYVETPLV
jgi:hypothetical protein